MIDPEKDLGKDGDTGQNLDDDWAAALSEQTAHTQSTQAAGLTDAADDWAAALAEQTAATSTTAPAKAAATASTASAQAAPAVEPAAAASAAPHLFRPLVDSAVSADSDIDMIMDIPVQLSVELGRTRLTIKNILQLGQGSVVELDGLAGEPMDIYVNGYLIAQGEVVAVEDKYGIRVTDIITPSDRIKRLNGRR
jgi:flagellar motor switch protein FliN/FliY